MSCSILILCYLMLHYFNIVLFNVALFQCCLSLSLHYFMLHFLMLSYWMLHYILLHYLVLNLANVELFDVALFNVACFLLYSKQLAERYMNLWISSFTNDMKMKLTPLMLFGKRYYFTSLTLVTWPLYICTLCFCTRK